MKHELTPFIKLTIFMIDDSDENKGLLDDDPSLDFILYQEMERENNQSVKKSGCLGVALIFMLPIGGALVPSQHLPNKLTILEYDYQTS